MWEMKKGREKETLISKVNIWFLHIKCFGKVGKKIGRRITDAKSQARSTFVVLWRCGILHGGKQIGEVVRVPRCPTSNYQCHCHARQTQTGICQSLVPLWRLAKNSSMWCFFCYCDQLGLGNLYGKHLRSLILMCVYVCVCLSKPVCLFSRMRRTSLLLGHHLGSPATLLFSSHQSEPTVWQKQFRVTVCMYVCALCSHHRASMCISCVCIRRIFMLSCTQLRGVWEWVTVRNYYLQADITKHPAILSSVCGGDTVSAHAGVYF